MLLAVITIKLNTGRNHRGVNSLRPGRMDSGVISQTIQLLCKVSDISTLVYISYMLVLQILFELCTIMGFLLYSAKVFRYEKVLNKFNFLFCTVIFCLFWMIS